jgi:hypothetical protein
MGFLDFGEIVEGLPGLYSIEKPWKGNQPFISCVPAGFYRLVVKPDGRYAGRWGLVGDSVDLDPGRRIIRTDCVFHPANWARQVTGCVALGMTCAMHPPKPQEHSERMVGNSGPALELFERRLALSPSEDHYVTIERDILTHS